MDKNNSYSIYVDRRPIRYVYLIDAKSVNLKQISDIIEGSSRKWGGRFNFILLVDEGKLDENQMCFLKKFDPDVIKLCTKLKKDQVEKIERRLSPYVVIELLDGNFYDSFIDSGLDILPTPKNISLVSNSSFESAVIVVFNAEKCVDEETKMFVSCNFGDVDLRDSQYLMLNNYENKIVFNISNKKDLLDALEKVNEFKNYMFPMQLCCIGDSFNQSREIDDNEFDVFVGSNPLDLINYFGIIL